jgi:hypothetical protein
MLRVDDQVRLLQEEMRELEEAVRKRPSPEDTQILSGCQSTPMILDAEEEVDPYRDFEWDD